jgi:hypothetical protein
MRVLTGAALAAALLAVPAAAGPPDRPSGPAPATHVATYKDGKIQWEYTVTRFEFKKEKRKVKTPDGKEVEQEVTVPVPVPEKHTAEIDAEQSRATRADGKPVAKAALKDLHLLAKPTTVVMSSDGQEVDPFWLQYYKPETLVIQAMPRSPISVPVTPRPKEGK